MRHFRDFVLAAALVTTSLSAEAGAQAAKPPVTPPSTAQSPTVQPATSAVPQQTTASFADWTLRCSHTSATAQICEVVQTITSQDRTVAQIAIGRVAKGQPLHLTILVPTSVTFAAAPALTTGRESDPPAMELAWRRCLPGGCVAEGVITEELLHRIRTWTDPARLTFADGAARMVALPFSPKGLPQALDALGKEDAG